MWKTSVDTFDPNLNGDVVVKDGIQMTEAGTGVLPAVTSEDEGKVLTVSEEGVWEADENTFVIKAVDGVIEVTGQQLLDAVNQNKRIVMQSYINMGSGLQLVSRNDLNQSMGYMNGNNDFICCSLYPSVYSDPNSPAVSKTVRTDYVFVTADGMDQPLKLSMDDGHPITIQVLVDYDAVNQTMTIHDYNYHSQAESNSVMRASSMGITYTITEINTSQRTSIDAYWDLNHYSIIEFNNVIAFVKGDVTGSGITFSAYALDATPIPPVS